MKTIVLAVLMIVSLNGAAHGGWGHNRDFERKLERADLLYRNGNYHAALKMYLELYRSDSANCNLCYKIGVCYLKSEKNSPDALPFFKKAVFETAKDYVAEDL